MTLPKEDNFHHKKTSSKNAVVEISDSQHETLRYCPQRVKPLESESGSLYVLSFVLCPTDCNWSPQNFEQIVGHNSQTVEPEDPDSDLRSSTSACFFKPSFVSKSLSFYHRIFAFLCFRIQLEKLVIRSFVSLHKNLKHSDTK